MNLERRAKGRRGFRVIERRRDLLEQCPYLEGLSPEDCALLNTVAEPVHMVDGEILFDEGDRDDRIFFIRRGEVSFGQAVHTWIDCGGPFGMIDFDEEAGGEVSWEFRRRLGAGGCLAEPGVICRNPHDLTACAEVETDLIGVRVSSLKRLIEVHPRLGERLFRALKKQF